jgi:hypothetical protein
LALSPLSREVLIISQRRYVGRTYEDHFDAVQVLHSIGIWVAALLALAGPYLFWLLVRPWAATDGGKPATERIAQVV